MFTPVYTNTFNTPLGSEWTLYNDIPKCCPQTKWVPSQVQVANDLLLIKNTRQPDGSYLSGGMSLAHASAGGNQTYGRWQMRFRFDAGLGIKMVALLWDAAPPPAPAHALEVDWAETSTSDATRAEMTSTLHYDAANDQIHNKIDGDFTQWHTMRVDWTPGRLSYFLDGKMWALTTGSHVPTQPMHLALQTEVGLDNGNGSSPDASTPAEVDLQIDWLRISTYSGA